MSAYIVVRPMPNNSAARSTVTISACVPSMPAPWRAPPSSELNCERLVRPRAHDVDAAGTDMPAKLIDNPSEDETG